MTAVDIQHIAKRIGTTHVLDDLSLRVGDGDITAILGDSGSGKTTLLRVIAGLEQVETGTISIGDRAVDSPGHHVSAQHRGVGYVPQDGALFPHLSVTANIGFGLHRRDRGRIDELLTLVELEGLADRNPGELSGGQQQRVALARALATRPRLILLDEPFSSLDASLRGELRRDLKRILKQTRTTAIIVTHDQGEAMSMSDRIAVLASGRIIDVNPPQELYTLPGGPVSAAHLGDINSVAATVGGAVAHCVLGEIRLARPVVDGPARILLRPEQIAIADRPRSGFVPAHVTDIEYFGHDIVTRVQLDDAPEVVLVSRLPWPQSVVLRQQVWLGLRGTALAETPADTPS